MNRVSEAQIVLDEALSVSESIETSSALGSVGNAYVFFDRRIARHYTAQTDLPS
jgi:hypothetical protein